MKNKKITKAVLKVSDGILSSLTDLMLWNLFYFMEIGPMGSPTKLRKAEYSAYRSLEQFNYKTIKRAFYNTKAKGWVNKDLTLTKEGRERLKNSIPVYFGRRKWDGNWYLVSYDIPEKRRQDRGVLRKNLKKLGFGEMHASLWLSPFDFLEEAEKLVAKYKLSQFVILAVSNKVGKEESKIFANKIWGLDGLNKSYKNIIDQNHKKTSSNQLAFKYFSVLSRDPQLPFELLPKDWLGEEAYFIFEKYLF